MVATGLVTACGELNTDWRGLRLERPQPMSREEVARFPAGSPERAFAAWYAAVLRRDATVAARAFARSANISTPALDAWWQRQPPPRNASPDIIDVDRRGRAVTLFVMLTTRYVAPNGRTVEFRAPRAATLVRSQGAWRLPGTWFLRSLEGLEATQRRWIRAAQV